MSQPQYMHLQTSSLQLPESSGSYCEASACLVEACTVVSSSVPSSLGSMAYVCATDVVSMVWRWETPASSYWQASCATDTAASAEHKEWPAGRRTHAVAQGREWRPQKMRPAMAAADGGLAHAGQLPSYA